MAGVKNKPTGPSSVLLWLFYRMYSARVTILWVMTVLLVLMFVIFGYVDQFCQHCVELDLQKQLSRDGRTQQIDQNPTVGSNSCLAVTFAEEGSQTLLALASYPGSGNTWLRHLMEHSTGIYTGSVYTDKRLQQGGFHGESVNFMKKSVLGVKMHRCSKKELVKFEALILLIRNPYHAMISEWHRYHSSGHVNKADEKSFRTKEWEEFVEEESSHWERMMRNCLKDSLRTMVVFYENLQANLEMELAHIHRFLRVPIDIERLKCVKGHSEGKFHRGSDQEFNPYTEEMVTKINRRIENAAIILKDNADVKFPGDYRKLPGS
ncbi:sialate:O-sulfotransferase 1-like [Lytechinus pictus]|uniref:sialate:O-sulfotransferase 1-like n=1 Tax=Lytechinus pictus TaxID=7653 RepID=UPI0030B9B16B